MVLSFKVAISAFFVMLLAQQHFLLLYLSYCNVYKMNVPKTNNYMQILILAAEITAGVHIFIF